MKRIGTYILSFGLLLSILFLSFVLVYTGAVKVTDSSLREREQSTVELESRAQERKQLAEHWRRVEGEYVLFREKYLINLEKFADFRRSLGEMFARNHLISSGFRYANRNSQDGKLVFVRFSFSVEGSYENVKRLLWELEHLPHIARLSGVSMKKENSGRISCGLDLEVIFEK